MISALFIDFDNVHSMLSDDDPNVGARFANRPLHWLNALATHPELVDGTEGVTRRIVSRRCYASPGRINTYRRNFTHAGFEVIDCPPLTTHMKNSADIVIVMDIMDFAARYPHIEEYIILSADADFVPVLNRLRREMKRTAIFTAANTSSAYRNCADLTIDTQFFALALEAVGAGRAASPAGNVDGESGAGLAPGGPAPLVTMPLDPALGGAVSALVTDLVKRSGTVPLASVAHLLRRELGGRLGSNWGGQTTFAGLLNAVDLAGLSIDAAAQTVSGEVSLSLAGWSDEETELLGDFAADLAHAAHRPVPMLPPGAYTTIFDAFAAYYRGAPQSFYDAVAVVAGACAEAGFAVSEHEIRFIGTGISMQGYRFGPDADPVLLASLWRLQVFDLCGEPEWMREEGDPELLAAWCHASGETIEAAREDFLAKTADEDSVRPDEQADPSAGGTGAL
jgi:hypothetical protein